MEWGLLPKGTKPAMKPPPYAATLVQAPGTKFVPRTPWRSPQPHPIPQKLRWANATQALARLNQHVHISNKGNRAPLYKVAKFCATDTFLRNRGILGIFD